MHQVEGMAGAKALRHELDHELSTESRTLLPLKEAGSPCQGGEGETQEVIAPTRGLCPMGVHRGVLPRGVLPRGVLPLAQ